MIPSDLIPGATYAIESKDERGKPWKGLAVYVKPDDTGGYNGGPVFEFTCEDGVLGLFHIEEVKALTQHQGSLSDQLAELHRIATQLKLYDAADWLRGHLRHG